MKRDDVLQNIEQADDVLLCEIIRAVLDRYRQLHQDWEMMFLSVHKSPDRRKEELEEIWRFLMKTEEKKDAQQ